MLIYFFTRRIIVPGFIPIWFESMAWGLTLFSRSYCVMCTVVCPSLWRSAFWRSACSCRVSVWDCTIVQCAFVLLGRHFLFAPYACMPWKFATVPEYAHVYFSLNFNRLLFQSMLWMCVQNLKFVALPVRAWDRGYFKNGQSSRIRPCSLLSKILMGFCSDGSCECAGQIWNL